MCGSPTALYVRCGILHLHSLPPVAVRVSGALHSPGHRRWRGVLYSPSAHMSSSIHRCITTRTTQPAVPPRPATPGLLASTASSSVIVGEPTQPTGECERARWGRDGERLRGGEEERGRGRGSEGEREREKGG